MATSPPTPTSLEVNTQNDSSSHTQTSTVHITADVTAGVTVHNDGLTGLMDVDTDSDSTAPAAGSLSKGNGKEKADKRGSGRGTIYHTKVVAFIASPVRLDPYSLNRQTKDKGLRQTNQAKLIKRAVRDVGKAYDHDERRLQAKSPAGTPLRDQVHGQTKEAVDLDSLHGAAKEREKNRRDVFLKSEDVHLVSGLNVIALCIH
jgi:hypothetical protein